MAIPYRDLVGEVAAEMTGWRWCWSPTRAGIRWGLSLTSAPAWPPSMRSLAACGQAVSPACGAADTARRQQVAATLDALLSRDHTWTAAHLVAGLADKGIRLSTRPMRPYLYLRGSGARVADHRNWRSRSLDDRSRSRPSIHCGQIRQMRGSCNRMAKIRHFHRTCGRADSRAH